MTPNMLVNQMKRFYRSKKNRLFGKKNRMKGDESGLQFIKFDLITHYSFSKKNRMGVCQPLPKTLTLFKTKLYEFSHPIYDLTKNSIPYLRPDP